MVIATAGEYFESPSGSLSWTLGECVIETFENSYGIITQGFQQSKLTITIVHDIQRPDFFISAYPNPATEYITVKISNATNPDLERLYYQLFNNIGQLLEQKQLTDIESKISVGMYPPSIYFLKVFDTT